MSAFYRESEVQPKINIEHVWVVKAPHIFHCKLTLHMFHKMNKLIDVFSVPGSVNDRCWFFMDDFASRSFEQYFQGRKSEDFNSYVEAHFDTKGFFNNFISSDNPSVISRMGNLVINAITNKDANKKQLPLLKLIVVVPDDDVIKIPATIKHKVSSYHLAES